MKVSLSDLLRRDSISLVLFFAQCSINCIPKLSLIPELITYKSVQKANIFIDQSPLYAQAILNTPTMGLDTTSNIVYIVYSQ